MVLALSVRPFSSATEVGTSENGLSGLAAKRLCSGLDTRERLSSSYRGRLPWTPFGGGFVVKSFAAYWFYLRFGVNLAALVRSSLERTYLPGFLHCWHPRSHAQFGLVRTMVFTHLPSNLLLILLPSCLRFDLQSKLIRGLTGDIIAEYGKDFVRSLTTRYVTDQIFPCASRCREPSARLPARRRLGDRRLRYRSKQSWAQNRSSMNWPPPAWSSPIRLKCRACLLAALAPTRASAQWGKHFRRAGGEPVGSGPCGSLQKPGQECRPGVPAWGGY